MGRPPWMRAGLALVAFACAGASAGRTAVYPPAAYAHRVSTTDVSIYWNCARGPRGVRVDGVAQDTGGGQVKFLELELAGADARNRYVSSAKTALKDIVLHPNQVSSFRLRLNPAGTETRYDLFYEYRLGRPMGLDAPQRFLARDACSPTQHRVPKPGH